MNPLRRRRHGSHRLLRKYENLKARLAAMLADGSFHLLEACRRMELLRKLSRRLHALNRLCLRAGVATAALAAGFLLLANAAQGGTGFVPQVNRLPFGNDNPLSEVNTGGYTRIALADFDGDGDLDCLLGMADGTVPYFFNDGNALHANLRQAGDLLPGGTNVGGDAMPAAGDLDGDGDLDLVIGEADGVLNYFENIGDPTTPSYVENVGAANPFDGIDIGIGSCPLLADLDGDGDLDLILGGYDPAPIPLAYFENTGSATAPVFVQRTGAANPFDAFPILFPTPSAADLDGDGDLDVLVGGSDGLFHMLKNIGSSTAPAFALRTGAENPLDGVTLGSFLRPALADLDSDGDADLLAGDDSGHIFSFENLGTPAVADFVQRQTFGTYARPAIADLDNDGDLDLSVGLYLGNIIFYENTTAPGDPTSFTPAIGAANPFDGIDVGEYCTPALVDIDDDGDLDLLTGDWVSFTLNFFENTGDAANPAFTENIPGNPFGAFTLDYRLNPDFVDIDDDGDFDCFIGTKYGDLRFFENTGTAAVPAFTEQLGGLNPFTGILPGGSYFSPSFSDFDGDGDFDLFLGTAFPMAIHYFENTGDPANPTFVQIANGGNPFAGSPLPQRGIVNPAVVDMDADGQLEAFVGDKYGAVRYYVPSERVAYGSGFRIMAGEVDNLGVPLATFTKKPAVTGQYFDPVKDPNELKAKTAKASVLTKIDAATPPDTLDCEWKSTIKLIDGKALKSAYKQGESADDFLARTPQKPLTMDLVVATVDGAGQAFTDNTVKRLSIMPPVILEVVSLATVTEVNTAAAGELLIIRGFNFGNKGAKAWMEYVDAKGVTKSLKLKALSTRSYPDAAGNPGKGIMDPEFGDSMLVVQVPTKWPKGWDHGVDHNLVLDNGVGLDSVGFRTEP